MNNMNEQALDTPKVNVDAPTLLATVFVVLKWQNIIDWDWIWVLSPIWIYIGLVFILTLIVQIILGIARHKL